MTDFFLQPGNLISIGSLGVAIVAIIIAYRSPMRTERIKNLNQSRYAHFDKIKDGCLRPLLTATHNVTSPFHLNELNRFDKNWILRQQQEGEPNSTILKSWVSLTNNTYGDNHMFEKLLYDDLENHMPELKTEIENVQKFLDEQYPIYHKKWIQLVIKIYDALENADGIKQLTGEFDSNVTAALLYAVDTDPLIWPNLYHRVSSSAMLDKIKNAIDQKEINELGITLRMISSKSLKILADLRESIDKQIKFEGELKGMCRYLQ